MDNLWFCPTCGDFGTPRWEGSPKSKPMRDYGTNRGITIRTCGTDWYEHEFGCNCGLSLLYCFRCDFKDWQPPSPSPKLWFSPRPL